MTRANLTKAYLGRATLSTAKLSEADLSGAYMRRATLNRVDLSAANLSEADLSEANLRVANLSRADLSGADLTNTNLSGAKLDGTILAYQKVSKQLQQEKQQLIEQVQLLQTQLDKQKLTEDLRQVSNQGVNAPHKWNSLYFRSQPEIRIAEALDKAGVLFYPNCKARLNTSVGREGKETDFLVFYKRKWGILEVDGEPWHPPSRIVHDHERDRLFKVHGIRVVEHYDANRCFQQPDEVVREFLEILKQA